MYTAKKHYTVISDESKYHVQYTCDSTVCFILVNTTHMVLSKELQDLVDVGYTGDQDNATVYVEVCAFNSV